MATGNFSSDVAGTPAATVTGTNAAHGIVATSDIGNGVIGISTGDGVGVIGNSRDFVGISGRGSKVGIQGASDAGVGVTGISTLSNGVQGISSSSTESGVWGQNTGGGYGVLGSTESNSGPNPEEAPPAGVWGNNDGTGPGVSGTGGIGVFGRSKIAQGIGVYGFGTFAGYFDGDVTINGDLQIIGSHHKSGGGFRIDHPQVPANKYLNHSFVEAPDRKNIYDGVVVIDAHGEALVKLPGWFDSLNQDFRYQLTAMGTPAPQLHIAEKIAHNHFKIAGGVPGMEVSWQVTGTRLDCWAQANPLIVEEDKSATEEGYYLHPELFGQAEKKSIQRAQNSQLMHHLRKQHENR